MSAATRRVSVLAGSFVAGWTLGVWLRQQWDRCQLDPYGELSRDQLAAAMCSWQDAPRYRVTQPGQRAKALRTWRRAVRVYRASRAAGVACGL